MPPLLHIRFKYDTSGMARRYDTKEIRDVIGALDCAGVPVPEMVRRLHAGEAGLKCGSIGISRRQVYNYRRDYRDEHGPPAREVDHDATLNSIEALEKRTVQLLAREIAAHEQKRPGKLTAVDARALEAHHKALTAIQRRSASVARSKPSKSNGNGSGEKEQAESALERLAREQAAA